MNERQCVTLEMMLSIIFLTMAVMATGRAIGLMYKSNVALEEAVMGCRLRLSEAKGFASNASIDAVQSDIDSQLLQSRLDSCEEARSSLSLLARHGDQDLSWLDILENHAESHTYDLESYNCVDYSRDAAELLRDSGWAAWTTIGRFKDGSRHMLVTVTLVIEPQTGDIVSPASYAYYGLDKDAI